MPGFDPIAFTFSENSNDGRESLLENKKFVDITQQCFAFTPRANFAAQKKVNFPANKLKVKVMESNPGGLSS